MLYLRMYRAELTPEAAARMGGLKTEMGRELRPILRPTLEAPAAVLGVLADDLRRGPTPRRDLFETSRGADDGEVFTDGETLLVLALITESQPRAVRQRRGTLIAEASPAPAQQVVRLGAIGPRWDPPALTTALAAAERVLGITMSPFGYAAERFDELKAEGRESPLPVSSEELTASQLLADRTTRSLAVAIKASGGLLVRDVPKTLSADARERAESLTAQLKASRLIDSEIVVVCSKTQQQVTRAATPELVSELSLKGLKCACGRPLHEERTEEALTITDLGRTLLEKGRWLTVLLLHELEAAGVSREAVLVEQTVGGDEIDCVTNISGELALFELKDKEFNLGNAYSFGAKIGIIRPRHPVVITTERVGNDAKEHFVRARLSATSREADFFDPSEGERSEILYIEGVHNLRGSIQKLVSEIYRTDSIVLLNQVLRLASLDGRSLLDALDRRADQRATVEGAA